MAFYHRQLTCLGRMAVFYLPATKLAEHPEFAKKFDAFLLREYQGLTKITQNIEGYYQQTETVVVKDDHVRYEVSFPGKRRSHKLINMLADVCDVLDEDSLYLTMGQHSYLVKRKNHNDSNRNISS